MKESPMSIEITRLEAVLDEKDAEIERLKQHIEAQEIRISALRENRAEDNQLIAELADALEGRGKFLASCVGDSDLLKRAREAAKDE
jgi:hypothetical protein